ncbi:hypothetical protein FQR65_LT00381 [Abscondita terminalis]|nr:hypothetical protein FQR65_LT00381 [Abscondita terminalis]
MNDEGTTVALSNHEVADFLREEGYYDPLLSEQEMSDLYLALSNSKNTASAEDEKRRTTNESTDDCDMLDDLILNSVPVTKDDLNGVGSDKSEVNTVSKDTPSLRSFQNDNFDDLDIFNSVPTNHPPLTRISYEPVYNPPLYCNPKFTSLSLEKRKKLMMVYHKKLIDIYDSYQRKSSNYAPLSGPILSDNNFNGSWLMDESKSNVYGFEDEYNLQDDNSNDIYISRSGRQTKRKLYTEFRGEEKKLKSSSSCKPVLKKKVESELNGDSKNHSPVVEGKKNRNEKLFGNLIVTDKKQEEQDKETDSFLDSLQVVSDDDDLFQDDTYTSRSGRQTKKKIYSEREDEKKSNIFQAFKWQSKKKIDSNLSQDSNIRSPLSEKRKNRSEKLFDDLLETEKVDKEEKKGENSIYNSLQVVSDDEETSKEVETVSVEEPFIRRRIVPPLRGIGRKNTSRPNSQAKKNPSRNKNETLEPLQSSASHVSSDLSQNDTYDVCPMCGLHFLKSKLEKHASECVDLHEKKTKTPLSTRTITCENCDLVMPLSTDYEVHVRECLSMSKAT